MMFHHVCPECGLDVVTEESTVQLVEIKACACPSVPVETSDEGV